MRFLTILMIMFMPYAAYAIEPVPSEAEIKTRVSQPSIAVADDQVNVNESSNNGSNKNGAMLDERIEDMKNDVLNLNRDLFVLEEQLLFPSNTQFAIYLSVDVGEYFEFESIRVLLDNKPVASYLYTERESQALQRGGVHRLHIGNMTSGKHELVAYYTGKGPNGRDFKRGVEQTITKGMGPRYIELKIADDPRKKQVNFLVKEWKN